jgi:hypothetical protein
MFDREFEREVLKPLKNREPHPRMRAHVVRGCWYLGKKPAQIPSAHEAVNHIPSQWGSAKIPGNLGFHTVSYWFPDSRDHAMGK